MIPRPFGPQRDIVVHHTDAPSLCCWSAGFSLFLLLCALAPPFALGQGQTQPQPTQASPGQPPSASPQNPQSLPPRSSQPTGIRVRVLNAKTNKPITDERLNVALRADQIGSVAMATDKNGDIFVDTGRATTIRVLANMYADCRPRGELYTDYPISTIRATGIVPGNLCSGGPSRQPKPGELLLFEFPKTYIPTMGQAPNTNLPHSDEQVPH